MRADKPSVTKALKDAGFTIADKHATVANERAAAGDLTVTGRLRRHGGHVRVFIAFDRTAGTEMNADNQRDANGFMWHYKPETRTWLEERSRAAMRALRVAGFFATVDRFVHEPVDGGEWFVIVEDGRL